jgi:hypothetical protein
MSQLAGALGGGGGASLQASSSASSGPQSGTTGSLLLDFGGINLGNQDIPLNAQSSATSNAPPQIGNVGASAAVSTLSTYLPWVLILGAVVALAVWAKGKL